MVNFNFLIRNIDFTNVNPTSSYEEIKEFCIKANKYSVKTIYVQPFFLSYVKGIVKQDIEIGTTGGFPFGNVPLQVKFYEIEYAAKNGAKWIDVCINLSNVKSKKWDKVREEIFELQKKSIQESIGLQLILEIPFLTNDEIMKLVSISEKEKVEFLKTASGVRNKITLDQLRFIKPLLKSCKLKVSGSILNLKEVNEFFENGADIVGSSKGFEIIAECLNG
mgnify:CR=1 FL=1